MDAVLMNQTADAFYCTQFGTIIYVLKERKKNTNNSSCDFDLFCKSNSFVDSLFIAFQIAINLNSPKIFRQNTIYLMKVIKSLLLANISFI